MLVPVGVKNLSRSPTSNLHYFTRASGMWVRVSSRLVFSILWFGTPIIRESIRNIVPIITSNFSSNN